MKNIPPLAVSILAALAAGTYRGGNDVRALDALERRGLVRFPRAAVLADVAGHARAGRSVELTEAGLLAVESNPRSMEWVCANARPGSPLPRD